MATYKNFTIYKWGNTGQIALEGEMENGILSKEETNKILKELGITYDSLEKGGEKFGGTAPHSRSLAKLEEIEAHEVKRAADIKEQDEWSKISNKASNELKSASGGMFGVNQEEIKAYLKSGKSAEDYIKTLAPKTGGGIITLPGGRKISKAEWQAGVEVSAGTENKMPSGVLVRNPDDGKVYFVDGDKKLRYITDPTLIQGKEVIDVDASHFEGIDFGADITEQPSFDFPTSGSQAKFNEVGIDFTQPRGFDPATGDVPTTPQGEAGQQSTAPTGQQSTGEAGEEEITLPPYLLEKLQEATGRIKPTQADLDNFAYNADKFEEQLDTQIQKIEDDKVATQKAEEDRKIAEQDKIKGEDLKRGIGVIDQAVKDGLITDIEADRLKKWLPLIPEGIEAQSEELLNELDKITKETIDPFYSELENAMVTDFKQSFQMLEGGREREREVERLTAGEDIRQAKAGLEKAGFTFTGKGAELLGEQAAVKEGELFEGKIGQASRLLASSSQARYQDTLQRLGRAAETKLGTAGAGALGIDYTPAGVSLTGELATAKEGKRAATLADLQQQYIDRLNLNKPK